MADKRVLYITQEISPYLSQTETSLLGRKLPQGIQERGFEVRTFMPKYGCINERRNQLHEVIRLSGMNIIIDDTDHPLIIKVASLQPSRIQVYFIDNEDYFQKSSDDKDEFGSNRCDNDERALFFARGTMETVKKLRWEPVVIHCSGWISMLAPIYLKTMYADDPAFRDAKIVYTISSGAFDGKLDQKMIQKLKDDGITDSDLQKLDADNLDMNAMYRFVMDYCDAVVIGDADVDASLVEYAKSKGLPCLSHDKAADDMDAYAEFYNSLI